MTDQQILNTLTKVDQEHYLLLNECEELMSDLEITESQARLKYAIHGALVDYSGTATTEFFNERLKELRAELIEMKAQKKASI